jgi:hypothetical protein
MAFSLQQFYAGLVIFITGGIAFLGKLLLLLLLLKSSKVLPGYSGHSYAPEKEAWKETV